jgi:hypothetical protein
MISSTIPHPLIANLEEDGREIISLWPEIKLALAQVRDTAHVRVDFDTPLQWGGSLNHLDFQFLTFLAQVEGIRQASTLTLIPSEPAEALKSRFHDLKNSLMGIRQGIEAAVNAGISGLTMTPLSLTRADNQKFDLDTEFSRIFQLISSASTFLLPIRLAARSEPSLQQSIEVLSRNSELLINLLADARSTATTIQSLSTDAKQAAKDIETIIGGIRAEKISAVELKDEISKGLNTISESAKEVNRHLASVAQVANDATVLSNQVIAYQAQFSTFQSSLDEKEQRYGNQSAKVDTMVERNEKNSAEIERLTKDANAMLTGATVAGLASAYAKVREELTRQLFMARWSFFVGIAFLTVSLLPLALYVFPYLFAWLPIPEHLAQPAPPPSDIKFEIYALQILARLAMLLPAAWFLRFAANRHASLFRLREEYSHRYSLASSVEGFRKQAEEFKGHIAAATYANISVNPATALDSSKKSTDGDPPNPFMRRFLDFFTKGLDKGSGGN